ncbi:MAG: hypothetical protein JO154_17275 [Chitinophaga sp.]|uniref:hypothetical protein n=1 Tax=Chitinophaga sp. TaxID=1869181 RepID=UPI0025C16092|nr:hypothetical protein [Chitinophaga sp.]MBV8254354.1 hypothetical protein [Chitinophaga sp.]
MRKIVSKIFSLLGIDGAIVYTLLARIIQAGGGSIAIIFIAAFLSKAEQGYYYTFASILALQIFFELGFSGIITQYAAHEAVHLLPNKDGGYEGELRYKSRLSSLLHIAVKWFSVLSLALFVVLAIAGFVFFTHFGNANTENVSWNGPWLLLSFSATIMLLVTPLLAFLEGLGKVREVAKIRLIQQAAQLLGLLLFLSLGLKLYAGPVATILSLMVYPIWILSGGQLNLLKNIWHYFDTAHTISFRQEIFPYQWRIALSWISGYFIFQLFNPVIFATDGPAAAGQMGMTLAILNGILSISLSWYNTKVPLFSSLIAKGDYVTLDSVFNKTIRNASLICGAAIIVFLGGIYILNYFNVPIVHRFLSAIPLWAMCIATFINQLVFGLATYLRCHKQEPLLIQSIMMGVFSIMSTIFLGKLCGVIGITLGYTFLTIFISLIGAVVIFNRKKREWHI